MSMIIDSSPDGIWNILEIVLTLVFFLMGFFFFNKYRKGKENAPKSTNDFNVGYAFFFWANGLNQFLYIADSIEGFIPKLKYFLTNGDFYIYIPGISPIGLKNQIVLMILLLLISATPLIKSIEMYLKKKEKTTIYKLSLFASIVLLVIYVFFFVINRAFAPDGFDGPILKYSGGTDDIPGLIINWFFIVFSIFVMVMFVIIMYNIFIYWLILTLKLPKGSFRNKTLMIFLGILALYLGLFVGNLLKPDLTGWLILLGPVFFFVSMLLLWVGFNKEVL